MVAEMKQHRATDHIIDEKYMEYTKWFEFAKIYISHFKLLPIPPSSEAAASEAQRETWLMNREDYRSMLVLVAQSTAATAVTSQCHVTALLKKSQDPFPRIS